MSGELLPEPSILLADPAGPPPAPVSSGAGPRCPSHLEEGTWLLVRDGVVVEASAAAATLLAVAVPGGLIGEPFDRLFAGEALHQAGDWEGALRSHDSGPGDDPTVPIHGRVSEVAWGDGRAWRLELEPTSILGALLHGMHRRETQLDLAIRSANGGLWNLWLDPADPMAVPDHCEISDSLQCLLGYRPGEMEQSVAAFRSHVLPCDRPIMDRTMGDYLRGATSNHEMEYRMQRRDGEVRWFRSCGRVLVDERGRPERWVGVEWDITERREREQEVRRNKRKFAALFRLSPVPIALVTYPEGRFVEVNAAFLRHLGRHRQAVLGRTDGELEIWRDHSKRRAFHVELAGKGRVDGRRMWMITANGEERAVEVSAERLRLEGRDMALLVGRDVTSEILVEERLRGLAHYDPLTGLPNRALLEERLERMLATADGDGGRTALFFIDLDNLKAVNDCYGHRAGDELIQAMAKRFRAALRPPDLLARLSGDEMVAVARVREEGHAREIGERLLASLSRPLELRCGSSTVPSASIGVAVAEGDPPGGEGRSGDALMRAADLAMYRVKRRGGGGVEVFDRRRDSQELAEQGATADLHLALDRDELELFYQPIVRLGALGLWGAEALLRWHHPTHGTLLPDRFIPAAEKSRLILPIGSWVLRQGCHQFAAWRRDGVVDDAFVLSINVSAHQLAEDSFVTEVEEVLAESGVPAANLQLEVTERVALSAKDVAGGLRQLGVRLAIDDFGEGYASLSYLRRLPVQLLKVDRSFTRHLTVDAVDVSLVRTIIFLANSLGQEVIAEGVETPEQLRVLRELGCGLGQGFLFAEPLRASQLAEVAGGGAARTALTRRAPAHLRAVTETAADETGPQPGEEPSTSPTLARKSAVEKGLARNGRSGPRTPRAVSASSR